MLRAFKSSQVLQESLFCEDSQGLHILDLSMHGPGKKNHNVIDDDQDEFFMIMNMKTMMTILIMTNVHGHVCDEDMLMIMILMITMTDDPTCTL